MPDQIKCLPLIASTDGPLFNVKPGTVSELTNMALQPGGFAEARGGIASLIPSGGTAPTWLSAGGYSAVHQLTTSGGWIRTYDKAAGAGTQYSVNRQLAPGGWLVFATGIVDDATYFGADAPFSSIGLSLGVSGAAAANTEAYEYYNGSTWAALTTSSTMTLFGGTQTLQRAAWTLPSDWAAVSVGDAGTGNVYKYWMRIRLSAVTTLTVSPAVIYGFGIWGGMRELYVACHNPLNGGGNGTLARFDQNGTTGAAFSISSSLFSGSGQPARTASYRGRVFMVNGKDAKRWDGFSLENIGLPEGTWACALTANNGAGFPAGIYRYYAAWGYGRCTVDYVTATPPPYYDASPEYGYGQATYLGEVTVDSTTTSVSLDFTGTTVPAAIGSFAVYRTQDLTNVPAAKRPNIPALLVFSPQRTSSSSTFGTAFPASAVKVDFGYDTMWPPVEMYNYDIQPPQGTKYLIVHQNRLLLGTTDTWYWSDPFVPDRFRKFISYMSLAKATGGRHMGGAEFADQAVLFTEDQTWALTNIDLDQPNVYPIHPGVGCIAPDSVATGDGLIVWAARDGIYAWDGGRGGPKKVSWDWNETFGKMSYETHGGSRAIIHNYHYDIRLAPPGYGSTAGMFRLNLLTMQWSTITFAATATDTLYPFGPIYGPLGSEDPGGFHPIYAHGAYSGANGFKLYLGEQTTQDDGTNYSCSGTGHFALPPGGTFVPQRILAYYMAANGWGTPALSFPPGTSIIGDPLGAITSGTPDTGSDYSVVGGTPAEVGAGTSDLRFKFTVSSAASGTVGRQRLFGFVLEGRRGRVRVGSV